MRPLAFACLLFTLGPLGAAGAVWTSPLLGKDLQLDLREPEPAAPAGKHPRPVVLYLTGLAAPRAGTEGDETIIRDLRADGCLVAVLDYAGDPRARMPGLARDLVALRSQLQHRTLLAGRDPDLAHVFIVPAGCRLKRDVPYYRDAGRTLAMDIIYPARPAHPVGAVLEFSCDNANRLGNFSLDFCTDTLLPGAAAEGYAVAMADHPVAAPYAGFDAMPDCAWKAKAAVRTLRAEGAALGLSGRIVPAGFSRGSGMALLLATTAGHPEFDGRGEHPAGDSSVQGAIVMSGRFTYLDLLPADRMIARYNQAWGERAGHEEVWRAHGALDYLAGPAVPLFLTINAAESPDALHQMEVLRRRLTALGSPFTYQPEPESRGHRMPLASGVLEPLFRYLQGQLCVAPAATPASPPPP
jgi:acetyl esterase/lipase